MGMRRSKGNARDRTTPEQEIEEGLQRFRALRDHYDLLSNPDFIGKKLKQIDEAIREMQEKREAFVDSTKEAPAKVKHYAGKVTSTEKLLRDIASGKVNKVSQAGRIVWESKASAKVRKLKEKLANLDREIERDKRLQNAGAK